MNDVLKAVLYPDSIALVGASATPGRLTARPLTFMMANRFGGRIYPVNRNSSIVNGLPSVGSVEELPDNVDHAYLLIDADPALKELERLARKGVRVVTVLADGFAESGSVGIERQDRLRRIANDNDMTVIGPNSMGVVETTTGFVCTTNAAFDVDSLPSGEFAVLSQSGSVIGALMSRGKAVGLGFKSYLSVGNEACLGVGELGQILVDDPQIKGFALFLETVRRPDEVARFVDVSRRAGKPVVAYLVGKSDAGRSLAASHTGAMIGGPRSIEAFLRSLGVRLVENFEALAEMSNAMRLRDRLAERPRRVTVVTTTGGGGGMVYDLIGLRGVPLGAPSEQSHDRLCATGLDIKPGPLVDVTLAGTKYDVMKSVMSTLVSDPFSGLIVAAIGSSAQFYPELAAKPIVDAVHEAGAEGAPVVAVPIPHAPESLAMFNANGVPAFRTAESAAECIAALLKPGAGRSMGHIVDAPPDDVLELIGSHALGALNEVEANRLFASLGLDAPEQLLVGPNDDIPDPMPFGGPYVLKVVSRDIPHKSEAGGVVVGLGGVEGLRAALTKVREHVCRTVPNADIEGFLVQRQESGLGEAIVGLHRDPVVGPIVSVGAGGVMTEVYNDLSLRAAPVDLATAAQMIEEVRAFALYRGYRNKPRGDLSALAEAVSRISSLACIARISEAEINPLLIREEGKGVVLLDALVRLEDSE